jgi:hypothetical protein
MPIKAVISSGIKTELSEGAVTSDFKTVEELKQAITKNVKTKDFVIKVEGDTAFVMERIDD